MIIYKVSNRVSEDSFEEEGLYTNLEQAKKSISGKRNRYIDRIEFVANADGTVSRNAEIVYEP